jgi:hypothetical protein
VLAAANSGKTRCHFARPENSINSLAVGKARP